MKPASPPPAIDRLLRAVPDLPRALTLTEARALAAEVRAGAEPPEDWVKALRLRVDLALSPHLRRVINATGVVLHTNLGRAPLSPEAVAALGRVGPGYSNLELDLSSGRRGERLTGVQALLARLDAGESSVVVNNNAAAVLLMLTALAAGREVVVSRGELVEIGGSFRVPEVVAAGGARLREVGATNRTRLSDYANAITADTAAILKVHPSNYRIVGFTGCPSRSELAALARERGVLLLEDLGSGALVPGLGEPTVGEALKEGSDLVCFSGDKLLGGPQAGLCSGRAPLVRSMRKHALYRALRPDRLVLAALEATLRGYLRGDHPPVVNMITMKPEELRRRAEAWRKALVEAAAQPGVAAELKVLKSDAPVGGGAVPDQPLAGWVLGIKPAYGSVDALAERLRQGQPAVISRVSDGRVCLDPRTVLADEEAALVDALRAALGLGAEPTRPAGGPDEPG